MAAQLSAVLAQRNHRHVASGLGSPDHAALAVSVEPTCGVPLIDGPDVIFGATPARAPAGASSANAPTASVQAIVTEAGCAGPSIAAAILAGPLDVSNSRTPPKWPDRKKSRRPQLTSERQLTDCAPLAWPQRPPPCHLELHARFVEWL